MYLYRKTLLSLFFFPAFIIFLSLNIVLSQGQSTPPLPSAPSALPSAIPSLPSSPVPPATPPAVPPAPPTAPPSSVRDDEEKSRVQISSDNLSGDDNKKMFRFWGNVNIRQKDGLLTSDEAVYNSKTKEAYANKNVKFTRPGTIITSDKVTVYYEEKRGIWEGNVHIVQEKNKKGDQPIKGGPVNLYCDSLEFFWEKPRKGTASGKVRVDQGDKHVSCDKATYTEDPQTILMENNVKLERDDGSWMTCDKMTLHVKEETVEGEGNVKGDFVVDKNKLE